MAWSADDIKKWREEQEKLQQDTQNQSSGKWTADKVKTFLNPPSVGDFRSAERNLGQYTIDEPTVKIPITPIAEIEQPNLKLPVLKPVQVASPAENNRAFDFNKINVNPSAMQDLKNKGFNVEQSGGNTQPSLLDKFANQQTNGSALSRVGGTIAKGIVQPIAGLTKEAELLNSINDDPITKARKQAAGQGQNIMSESMDKVTQGINQYMDYDNMGKVSKFVSDTAASIPQMTLNFIPGVGQVLFGASAAGNYSDEAKKKGATDNQALAYGAIGGGLEVGLNSILGIVPGIKNIFKEAFEKGATTQTLKNVTAEYIKNMGKEGLEEAVIEPFVGLAEKAIFNKDKAWTGNDGVIDPTQMGLSFLGGALMSGMIGSPAMIKKTVDTYNKKNPQNPVTEEEFKSAVEQNMSNIEENLAKLNNNQQQNVNNVDNIGGFQTKYTDLFNKATQMNDPNLMDIIENPNLNDDVKAEKLTKYMQYSEVNKVIEQVASSPQADPFIADIAQRVIEKNNEKVAQEVIQTGSATWKNKDYDQPVTITGFAGEFNGKKYANIKESNTAIPLDEVEYNQNSLQGSQIDESVLSNTNTLPQKEEAQKLQNETLKIGDLSSEEVADIKKAFNYTDEELINFESSPNNFLKLKDLKELAETTLKSEGKLITPKQNTSQNSPITPTANENNKSNTKGLVDNEAALSSNDEVVFTDLKGRVNGGRIIKNNNDDTFEVEHEGDNGKEYSLVKKVGEEYKAIKSSPTPKEQIPMEERNTGNVGNKKIKAYQYLHPELKSFIQSEANILKGELADTLPAQRSALTNEDGEVIPSANPRITTEDIAKIKNLGASYADIEKALDNIIKDHGAENTALAKKIEVIIDDRLSYGYNSKGQDIPENEEYLTLKSNIENPRSGRENIKGNIGDDIQVLNEKGTAEAGKIDKINDDGTYEATISFPFGDTKARVRKAKGEYSDVYEFAEEGKPQEINNISRTESKPTKDNEDKTSTAEYTDTESNNKEVEKVKEVKKEESAQEAPKTEIPKVEQLQTIMDKRGIEASEQKRILDYISAMTEGAKIAGKEAEVVFNLVDRIEDNLSEDLLKEHGLTKNSQAYIAGKTQVKQDGNLFKIAITLVTNKDMPISQEIIHEAAESWNILWKKNNKTTYDKAISFLTGRGLDKDRAEEHLAEIMTDYVLSKELPETLDKEGQNFFKRVLAGFERWLKQVFNRISYYRLNVIKELPQEIKEQAELFASGKWEEAFKTVYSFYGEYNPALTSLNQVAALFNKPGLFQPKGVNFDIGGGVYDKATTAIKERYGTENIIYDTFSRDYKHNKNSLDYLLDKHIETTTSNNVLNTIKDKQSRLGVIAQNAAAVDSEGISYFMIYEDSASSNNSKFDDDGLSPNGEYKNTGTSRVTWQNKLKTSAYLDEIKEFYGEVVIKNGNIIMAKKPLKDKLLKEGKTFLDHQGTQYKNNDGGLALKGEAGTHAMWNWFNKHYEFEKENKLIKVEPNRGDTLESLKTKQGSVIKRSKYGVGKEIGGQVYVHKNYAADVVPVQVMSKALELLKENHPDFKYNTIMYNSQNQTVRFDEAPDFDTAREPMVGKMITVNTRINDVKEGHSSSIWHHKWLWVKDDYKGFDVKESYNWSKHWLSMLDGKAQGTKEAWLKQLDDNEIEFNYLTYSRARYSTKDIDIDPILETYKLIFPEKKTKIEPQIINDRDTMTIERVDEEPFVVHRGDRVRVYFGHINGGTEKVFKEMTIIGISHANKTFKVKGDISYNGGFDVGYASVYPLEGKAEDIVLDPDAKPLSDVIENINKANAPKEGFTEADRVPTLKKEDKKEKSLPKIEKPKETNILEDITKFNRSVRRGENVTFEEAKAMVDFLINSEETVKAELSKLKNDELKKMIGGFYRNDYKTKPVMVEKIYEDQLSSARYNLTGENSYTHTFGSKESVTDGYKRRLKEDFSKLTEESFNEMMIKNKENYEKAVAERKSKIQGMEKPVTLDDFKLARQVRKLTKEEQATYEDLNARFKKQKDKQLKERNTERKVENAVSTIAELGEYSIEKSVHTKKNTDIWIVRPKERLEKEAYKSVNESMKKLGAYYSSFSGVNGFVFSYDPTEVLKGDTSSLVVKEPEKKNYEKLRELAAKEDLSDSRRKTLNNIADAMEKGEVELIDRLQYMTEIDTIESLLNGSQYKRMIEEKIPFEYTREGQVIKKPLALEDITYAEMPVDSTWIDNIKRLIKDAEGKKGTVLISNRFKKLIEGKKDNERIDIPSRLIDDLRTLIKATGNEDLYLNDLLQNRMRFERLGIENDEDLRAYLREYFKYRQGAKLKSKEELEKEERLKQALESNIAGFFPTPKGLVERMLEEANIQESDKVLEPSAGMGHIADAIGKGKVDVVEWNSTLNQILKDKGHNVVGDDALAVEGEYNKIVMNPPFEKNQDIEHVMYAYNNNLAPGGRIVAIMSEHGFFAKDKKSVAFREWLDDIGGVSEELPQGSFLESDRKTGVNTRIVIIDKPSTRYMINTKASNFERWFGSSKVVNKDGSPMVVYHGTGADEAFNEFEPRWARSWGKGIYFTDEVEYANIFSENGENSRIYPAYIKIENPFDGKYPGDEVVKNTKTFKDMYELEKNRFTLRWNMRNGYYPEDADQYEPNELEKLKAMQKEALKEFEESYNPKELWDNDSTSDFANSVIRDLGYDGIVTRLSTRHNDDSSNSDSYEIVAFNSNQIKSAIGNNGDYDTNNDDVRYSVKSWILNKFSKPDAEQDYSETLREAREEIEGASGKKANRQFIENSILNAEAITDNVKDHFKNSPEIMKYVRNSNLTTMEKAEAIVENNFDKARAYILSLDGFASDLDTAIAIEIEKQYMISGRELEASQWGELISPKLTASGRAVQYASVLKRFSPMWVLNEARKTIEEALPEGSKKLLDKESKEALEELTEINKEKVPEISENVLIKNPHVNEILQSIVDRQNDYIFNRRLKDMSNALDNIEKDSVEDIIEGLDSELDDFLNEVSADGETRYSVKVDARYSVKDAGSFKDKVNKIVRDYYNTPYFDRPTLEDVFMEELGLTSEQATNLVKRIDKTAIEKTEEKAEKVLGKEKDPRPKEKKAREKVKKESKGKDKNNKDEVEPDERLATRIENHLSDPKTRKNDPIDNMVKTLYEVAKVELPKKKVNPPTNPISFITEAITSKEEYQDIWTKAQDKVKKDFEGNQEALDQLEDYFGQILEKPFADSQLDKAITMTMKDLQVKFEDIITKHYSVADNLGQTLINKLVDAGLSQEDAKNLAWYIDRNFKRLTGAAKEKYLDNKFRKIEPAKRKTFIENVVEYSNLGALNSAKFRPMVAEKYKIPTLSEEKAQELTEMVNKYQTMEEGKAKIALENKIRDTIRELIPSTKGEKWKGYQYISMLLNPKTSIRNISGNILSSATDSIDRIAGMPMELYFKYAPKILGGTGKRSMLLPSLGNRTKGIFEGYKSDWSDFIKNEDTRKIESDNGLIGPKTFKAEGWQKPLAFLERLNRAVNSDRGFFEPIYNEVLAEEKKLAELNGEKFDLEKAKLKANIAAEIVTFKDDNFVSTIVSQGEKLLNGNVKIGSFKGTGWKYGPGTILFRFARTGFNIAKYGVDHQPLVAFSKAIVRAAYDKKNNNEFNQQAFVKDIGKGLTGTGLLLLGGLLSALGWIDLDDEEDNTSYTALQKMIGGNKYVFNFTAIARGERRKDGPQEGDHLVTFDWMLPISTLLTAGARMQKARDMKEVFSITDTLMTTISTTANGLETLLDQPFLQTIKRWAYSGDWKQSITETMLNEFSSVVPQIVNQFKQLTDNQTRETYDPNYIKQGLNRTINKIPVLSKTLEPKINVLGDKQEMYKDGTNNLWNVFLNPSFSTTYIPSKEAKIVLDLYKATGGETKQLPSLAPKKFTITNKTYNIGTEKEPIMLTPEEYRDMQIYMGTESKKALSKINVANLKPEDAVKRIDSVLSDITSKAKDNILKARGIKKK